MHNVIVSVGVSHMGKTDIFIEPGAKVNSLYYCENVLDEGLLPDIGAKRRQYRWTLQQDGACTLRETRLGCTAAGWTH